MKAGNFIIKKRPPAPHHKDIENKRPFDFPIIQLLISFSVMIEFVNYTLLCPLIRVP